MCKFEKDFHDPAQFFDMMSGGYPSYCALDEGYCAGGSCGTKCSMVDEIQDLPSGTKISDYYDELDRMESQEREEAEILQKKENGLKELKDLRAKFAKKDRSDIVERINVDIKDLEAEIKTLKG